MCGQIGKIYFDPQNAEGCDKVDQNLFKNDAAETGEGEADGKVPEDSIHTKILILDRGNCSFVHKVRNAERGGAGLVVVVDNNEEDIENVIMGDDGTGIGIRIPSMLIGKNDGKILKEFASKNKNGTLSAEFSVKTVEGNPDIEFWYSSNNVLALDFLKEFDVYAHKLEGYINFSPRFVTYAC